VIREFAGTVPAYAAPGDAGALADAVRAVLDDPGQAEARARAGMAMARSLTWEATAEGTARAIEAAGADPTRHSP
jgi:glycosyltransferase involved in cell wall biosynthesis